MDGKATGDNSVGNKDPNPAVDSNSDDETGGSVGSLLPLIKVGADEDVQFSLGSTAGLKAIGLLSHGEQLDYSISGNVLTAFTSFGTVFTLTLNGNGSWSFDLQDQLDHVAGNGENFDLKTASGQVPFIDLSSVINITDFDGDPVGALQAGMFRINV